MHVFQKVRRLVVTALVTGLVAAVLASCGDARSDVATANDSRSAVAIDSSADRWKTVEYRGVQLDIPVGWTRADMQDCEFRFERWTPPDQPACSPDGGVSFYASATFDPAYGRPGIRHDHAASDAADWAGYVYAGDLAVYVADDDRGLVQHVLRSASASGE